MNTPYAFVARIEAKPERPEEVAELLSGALALAVRPGPDYQGRKRSLRAGRGVVDKAARPFPTSDPRCLSEH